MAQDTSNLSRLTWLADAPLFLDARQIERFYDSVIRPTYVEGLTTITVGEGGEITYGGEGSVGGKLAVDGGLLKWFTGASGEVSAEGKLSAEKMGSTSKSRETQWLPVRTPDRQLAQLVINYDSLAKHRLLEYGPGTDGKSLFAPETATALPRAIIVLDLPGEVIAKQLSVPTTNLYPMAAELNNGKVKYLFELLRKELESAAKEHKAAVRKSQSAPPKKQSKGQQIQLSWEQYADYFDPWTGMKVIEEGVDDQRIRWIDFQMSCAFGMGQKLHLHICPAGEFDTGVFAYNFVYRAFKYGVRIVGTLKSGADINVLAIFDK